MPCHKNHQSCCVHLNVKYCACCRKVYCQDCGKEWSEWGITWTSPTYTYPTWITSSSDTISGIGSPTTITGGSKCHQ